MKQLKAQKIAECLNLVSQYYNTPIHAILSESCYASQNTRDARHLLWWHMHDCGMSYEAIGKLPWKKSHDTVYKGVRRAALNLVEKNECLMTRLPRIPTTFTISNA